MTCLGLLFLAWRPSGAFAEPVAPLRSGAATYWTDAALPTPQLIGAAYGPLDRPGGMGRPSRDGLCDHTRYGVG
jgi:hypothetical protein